jgi:hypothetical protein
VEIFAAEGAPLAANLPPVSLTPVANMHRYQPVSTTPKVPVAEFATSVVDINGAPSE